MTKYSILGQNTKAFNMFKAIQQPLKFYESPEKMAIGLKFFYKSPETRTRAKNKPDDNNNDDDINTAIHKHF